MKRPLNWWQRTCRKFSHWFDYLHVEESNALVYAAQVEAEREACQLRLEVLHLRHRHKMAVTMLNEELEARAQKAPRMITEWPGQKLQVQTLPPHIDVNNPPPFVHPL